MSEVAAERFAENIRRCGGRIRKAQEELSRAEAELKRTIARVKVEGAALGIKANNAQEDYADRSDDVFNARLHVGVCRGELDAAMTERRACEVDFELWRTKQANDRAEGRRYGQ